MEVFAAMVEVMDTEIGASRLGEGSWNTLFALRDNGACPFERTRG